MHSHNAIVALNIPGISCDEFLEESAKQNGITTWLAFPDDQAVIDIFREKSAATIKLIELSENEVMCSDREEGENFLNEADEHFIRASYYRRVAYAWGYVKAEENKELVKKEFEELFERYMPWRAAFAARYIKGAGCIRLPQVFPEMEKK